MISASLAPSVTHHCLQLADRTPYCLRWLHSHRVQILLVSNTDLKHRFSVVVHRQDVGDAILGEAFSVFCVWDRKNTKFIGSTWSVVAQVSTEAHYWTYSRSPFT